MIGIRGAVRAERNDRDAIRHATRRLLREMERRNGFRPERVVSAFFTMTPDLDADFPAYAARELGWSGVPMLGAQETPVDGALDRVIRVLLHADVPGPARHVYLGETAAMRPDLADPEDSDREGDHEPSGLPAAETKVGAFGPLLVCGLGLIGGSIALGLRAEPRFRPVLGVDPDGEAVQIARAAGAVSRAGGEEALPGFLAEAKIILLAMPVDRVLAWLRERGPRLRPGQVVLDVASSKRGVVEAMGRLPEGVEALGTHPMAGSEARGMAAARPDLFQGAAWALVETGRTGSLARKVASALIEALGARPRFVDAAAHDRAVATASHLPYLVSSAVALRAVREGVEVGSLAGPGLRDMVRLAGSDPGLLAGILATNRDEVRKAAAGFRETLSELEAGLESGEGGLRELLEAARAARKELRMTRGTSGRPGQEREEGA